MIDGDPVGVSINLERAQETTACKQTSILPRHWWQVCLLNTETGVWSGLRVCVCAFVLQYERRSDGKRRDAGRRVCESESPSPYLPPTLAIFTVYLTASSTTAWTHTHTYIFGSGIGYFDLNLHIDIWDWPESLWGHWAAPSDCLSLLRSQWIIFAPYN